VAGHLVDRLAFAEELLALGQEPDDLLGGVASTLHGVESILPMLGIGLAQRVDQVTGIRSMVADSLTGAR
jgi:hydrogenase/urease accessory protein HupE